MIFPLMVLCILSSQCTVSTACMCIYGLLSFVLTSLELHTLGNQQVSIQHSSHLLSNLIDLCISDASYCC